MAASLAAYFVWNWITIGLAMGGVIHPPWSALEFFSWIGPVIAASLIALLQVLSLLRPSHIRLFSWRAMGAAILCLFIAAMVNVWLFAQAVANAG